MTDLKEIRRLVGRDSLLAALPEDSIQKLLALGKPRRFAKGEVLIQQGDEGDSAYLILSGAVKVSVVSPAGREIVFAYLSVGDLVGDISILDERPRAASSTAAEAVNTMVIRGADLHREMAANPELARAVIRFLCARLRATNQLLESDRSFQTGPRLARGILRLLRERSRGNEDAASIDFAISQTDLGAFVSLSRENVNRQLKDWSRAGLLEVKAGKIIVKDREALEDAAESEF
jgi:CRP-like cAMP-binding protein